MAHSQYRTWSQHRASRLRLDSYPTDFPVHVVISAHRRRAVFASPGVARTTFRIVRSHERTLAAVLMPDHLHWIIDCAEKAADAVELFKSLSTRLAWKEGVRGKLWQRSYFDTVIRGRESLEMTIRSVLANPVRAGLAENAEDYPWSYDRFEICRPLAPDRSP